MGERKVSTATGVLTIERMDPWMDLSYIHIAPPTLVPTAHIICSDLVIFLGQLSFDDFQFNYETPHTVVLELGASLGIP